MFSAVFIQAFSFLADIDAGTVGVTSSIGLGTLGGIWKILKGFEDRIKTGVLADLKIGQEGTKTQISPQPLEVRAHVEYATAAALGQLRREVAETRKEMDLMRNDIAATAEQRAIRIHDRIDKLSEKVGELVGQLKLITQAFGKGGRS